MCAKRVALSVPGRLMLATSGCAGGPDVATPTDQAAFGTQICGLAGDDTPGYRNTMPVLPSSAWRLSGAGATFVAPVMSVWPSSTRSIL